MLLYLYFLLLSVCLLWVCCLRQYRDIKINSHPQASVLHQGSSGASLEILWSWNFWELHILDAADKNHSSIMHQSSHLTQNHLKPSCNLILNFYSLYSLVIVKLTHFIQVSLCSPSSMPTPLRDSPKSYWTALLNSLPNGQDLSNCSKSSFTNCSHTESLCIISVLIQKCTDHISVGWKCPHTP